MFKLYKGKISDIIKDEIAQAFGFGTKKERIDHNLGQYRINEVNNINYIIAQRNILISKLNTQLANYDRILNPLKEFETLYKKIEELSEQEIIKNGSAVSFTLKRKNGSIYANGNYATLRDAIKLEKNADEAIFLYDSLEKMRNKAKTLLIEKIINNNGTIYSRLGEIYIPEICTNFQRLKQLVSLGLICNSSGNPYIFSINNFNDATLLRDSIRKDMNSLEYNRNAIYYNLNSLKSASASDESTLNLIEKSKELIRKSPEYIAASLSDEYLKGKKNR